MNKNPDYIIENSPYVVELTEYIEQVFTEKPDKRKKKIYNEWKEEINKVITRCNKLANMPLYALVK